MEYVMGALALGSSLDQSGSQHPRVLLHTDDVPNEALQLLGQVWQLCQVSYIISAGDLHVASDKAKFREVFTKLHVLNPDALPYDKVVFLDLDMIVLRNVDELFELRPPAAMSTFKSGGLSDSKCQHDQRLPPDMCYINAGTMVVAPSKELFELLLADVLEPDPLWHLQAWSPEQKYLSNVMSGEWSHVSQLYNFEVQLHSGVPLSQTWHKTKVDEIAVAHFSGAEKVWDTEPDGELPVLGNVHAKDAFALLPPAVQRLAEARCRLLHAEWHFKFAHGLRRCRAKLPAELDWRPAWRSLLATGTGRDSQDRDVSQHGRGSIGASWSPGDHLVVEESGSVGLALHLATALRPKGCSLVLYRQSPGDRHSFEGLVESRDVQCLKPVDEEMAAEYGLGCKAVAWLGEGHSQGLVVARSGNERLLQIGKCWTWLPVGSLMPCVAA